MSDIVKRIPDHFWDFLEDGDFAKFAKREGQMSDIVKWLRSYHKDRAHGALHEAADEIARLEAELDKATRLVGQSIQWQRDAEIKMLELRAATIEECAQTADEWYGSRMNESPIGARIRALKEQK